MRDWVGLGRHAEEEMEFYKQIAMRMSILTAVLVLPFSIFHFLYGHLAVALSTLAVVLLKTGVMLFLRRGGSGVVGVHVVALTYTLSTVMTIHLLGTVGYFWLYTTMVAAFYSLPRRSSMLVNGAAYLAVLPVALADADYGVRFIVTAAMVFLFGYILASRVRAQSEELRRLARIDALTGAGNRRAMDEELERAIREHDRYGRPAAVIMLDLDHFKQINDRFGHKSGDRVLAAVADGIRERLRAIDRLFRFGGEEFVVLAPTTPATGALRLAEDLREKIASLELDGVPRLSASFGVAERCSGEGIESWLARADAALYDAKAAGRNRVIEASDEPVLHTFDPFPQLSPA